MTLPSELHVYSSRGRGLDVTRLVLRNAKGAEVDLVPYGVSTINRKIEIGRYPLVEVTLMARLVEHGEEL